MNPVAFSPLLSILAVITGSCIIFIYLERRVQKNRISNIFGLPLPAQCLQRLREHYPGLTTAQYDEVEMGLRQFFLCFSNEFKLLVMPSKVAGDLWHEFTLCTREYEDFCRVVFNLHLDYRPSACMQANDKPSNEGLRRCWWHACKLQKIDPNKPASMPLLFELDSRLGIADGFHYTMEPTTQAGTLTQQDQALAKSGMKVAALPVADFSDLSIDGTLAGFAIEHSNDINERLNVQTTMEWMKLGHDSAQAINRRWTLEHLVSLTIFLCLVLPFFWIFMTFFASIPSGDALFYFFCAAIAVIIIAIISSITREFDNRRISNIFQYPLPPGCKAKLRQLHPGLTAAQCDEVELSLRQFFHCYLDSKFKFVAMPSRVADDLWREFMLHAREYEEFCQLSFGRLLRHQAAGGMHPQDRKMNAGLRRCWWRTCSLEEIDPAHPQRLPRLFALDASLNIAGGFYYRIPLTPGQDPGLSKDMIEARPGMTKRTMPANVFFEPDIDGTLSGFGPELPESGGG